jgi:hypothetical protein
VMGVDHVSAAAAAAAASASAAGGGGNYARPVVTAVRSVIDGTTSASSNTGAAAAEAGQPLFDQQAIVYIGERLNFLTAYTAGCDAITCMTNRLYGSSSTGAGGGRNGNSGAEGSREEEEEEEDISISTFKAAKWARRLVSTANSARVLLARNLTAATQCDMHQILAVTSHTGGGALGGGSFKGYKSQTQVRSVVWTN